MEEEKISLNKKRTKYCGDFTKGDINKKVVVMGWVEKQRDLGNLIFIDLRDRTGTLQLAISQTKTDEKSFQNASICRAEFVVAATGEVRERKEKNTKIKTGEIEISVLKLEIISKSKTPPFSISNNEDVSLELRLKYRYLDLRNEKQQQTFKTRHKIVKHTRDFFDENGFLEIETPMLIKSTPEGARDYLVPSRIHKGSFYALPQSPQLYKQLLMVSGFDRYFQIARCFRDEDLRADRQPEFSQIDIEMSFIDVEDIISINEKFMKSLFSKILDINLKTPFLKLSYDEAMNRFGCDKPDTRFSLELVSLNSIVLNSSLNIFKNAIENGGCVYALNLENKANLISRKTLDKLNEIAKTYKAKGVFFSKILKDEVNSNFEKFLDEDEIKSIYKTTNAKENDVILIIADEKKEIVFQSLCAIRLYLGEKFELYDKNQFSFVWVVNFPLFEYNEEEKRLVSKHHPFTMIEEKDLDKLKTAPELCHAKAYDLVLNGCEIGGGSIRIHKEDIQNEIFKTLKLTEKEIEEKFGFLVKALQYGAPPHGGMAYGLDRLVMLMLRKNSIRDVIAFPKVQNACELMTNSPSFVQENQLEDLNIKIKE